MPLFTIQLRDSEFCTRDEGAQFDDPEAALAMGVRGALSLAVDEINRGSRSVAIEINVEQEDGAPLLTSVLAVSVSPMMTVRANLGGKG